MYYMDPDKWHTAVSEMEDYTVQDYDKAKEYLAKSKYPDGFEFDFYTLSANVPEAELIQSMVGEIGIKMQTLTHLLINLTKQLTIVREWNTLLKLQR